MCKKKPLIIKLNIKMLSIEEINSMNLIFRDPVGYLYYFLDAIS